MTEGKKYSKYLPSKQFTLSMSLFIVLLVIIFFIFYFFSENRKFTASNENKNELKKLEDPSVLDLIQSDLDGDGVLDWEEALWGTDKSKTATWNGIPDAKYIENKRKELNIEEEVDNTKLTETEQFARQFFTTYAALKGGGEEDTAINNFSKALGERIADPTLTDEYTEKDVKISSIDNADSHQKYYAKLQALFDKYRDKGLGSELNIVNSGLITNNSTGEDIPTEKLLKISSAYREFASLAVKVETPKSFVKYQLQIVNSANNTGISVKNMTKIISDPLVGLSGLSQYDKYSTELTKSVGDLETALGQ